MDLGPAELAIILAIVLLLFGGKKLPELARSLGQAKKEFEDSSTKPADVTATKATATKATATSPTDDTTTASPSEASGATKATDAAGDDGDAPA